MLALPPPPPLPLTPLAVVMKVHKEAESKCWSKTRAAPTTTEGDRGEKATRAESLYARACAARDRRDIHNSTQYADRADRSRSRESGAGRRETVAHGKAKANANASACSEQGKKGCKREEKTKQTRDAMQCECASRRHTHIVEELGDEYMYKYMYDGGGEHEA
jgi:hypothetical protein